MLVMSSYDAPHEVIAAAIGISVRQLQEFYTDDLSLGNVLKHCNLTHATWALAREGKWSAINGLLRRMEGAERREHEQRERKVGGR